MFESFLLSRQSNGAGRIVVRALIIRLLLGLACSCCNFGNPKSRTVHFLQNFLYTDDHGVPRCQKLHIMGHCRHDIE